MSDIWDFSTATTDGSTICNPDPPDGGVSPAVEALQEALEDLRDVVLAIAEDGVVTKLERAEFRQAAMAVVEAARDLREFF